MIYADLRRITFSGNRDVRLDSGERIRAGAQTWTPARQTPVLFEGEFCRPVMNVELRLSEPLKTPERMLLKGVADNGLIFLREFTYPAGKYAKTVSSVASDRAIGGVFDALKTIKWELTGTHVNLDMDRNRVLDLRVYFVPRWTRDVPPFETLVAVVCTAMKGRPTGHASALENLWAAFRNLSVPTGDDRTQLTVAARQPVGQGRTVKDLLKRGSGGSEAWCDFFRASLRAAGFRPEQTKRSVRKGEPWPWTVGEPGIKMRLLEAKCRQAERSA